MRYGLVVLAVWFCLTSTASANFSRSIDNSGDVGKYISMVMDGAGNPILAYYDDSADDLKISLCADTTCDSITRVVLDATNDVGKYTSLALTSNGFPAVAYFDDTLDDLKLALCNDALCGSVTLRTLDETGVVGEYVSMARGSDGLLVGAYYDRTNGAIKTFHCTTSACDSPELVPLTPVGGFGTWLSLKIAPDTLPMISFYDGLTGDLRLADCSSIGCSAATYVTLDSTDNVGVFSSLAFANTTRPVVSYYDATNARLKVVECLNTDCSNKSTITVDALNTVGQYPSMVMGADGYPIIAYHDVTLGDLKVADCANTDCSSRTLSVIETSAGVYSSIARDAAGNIAIGYYHSINTDVYFARLQNYTPQFNAMSDPVGVAGQPLTFTVSATDLDNAPPQTLTYAMVGQVPSGATLNSATGQFFWTPTGQQIGTYVVVFFVTDNGLPALTNNTTVVITVDHNNLPPTLHPVGDVIFNEGILNTLTLTGNDPDVGQSLSYSATGLPTSADLNASTGVLTWTPSASEVGFYTVTFIATDNGTSLLTDSETIRLQVRDQLISNPTLNQDSNGDRVPDSWQFKSVPKLWYACASGNCTYTARYDANGSLRQNADVRWLDVGDVLTLRASLSPRNIPTQEVVIATVFYPDGTKAKLALSAGGSLPALTVFESAPLTLTQRPYKVQVRVQLRGKTSGRLVADDIYLFAESGETDPTRAGAISGVLPLPPPAWRSEGGS